MLSTPPAASHPRTVGRDPPIVPRDLSLQSTGLTPAASRRTRTSCSEAISGSASSVGSRTSGPPTAVISTARMRHPTRPASGDRGTQRLHLRLVHLELGG